MGQITVRGGFDFYNCDEQSNQATLYSNMASLQKGLAKSLRTVN